MRARLTLFLPRAGFGALVLAVFAVPIAFTRQTAEAFMVPKHTLLWLCLLVATVGVGLWCAAARAWPMPRLRILLPASAVLLWTAVATATSTSPMRSLLGQYGRYDGLLGQVGGVLLLCLVVATTWRRPGRLVWFVRATLASAAVGLAYVAVQQFGWDPIRWLNETGEPIERPYGLLGNSNFSGAHLAVAVPLALLEAHRATSRRVQGALLAFAALLALGVWWTGTRGGLLALLAGSAAAGLVAPGSLPRYQRWASGGLAVAAAVVLVLASTANTVPGTDLAGSPRFLQADTLADRRDIWGAGWDMLADHPVVGVGPDAFGLHFLDYLRPRAFEAIPLNADEAHNVFVDRAATTGVPGLLSYLWLLVALGLAVVRARRTVAEEEDRWLLAAFVAMATAYLAQGLVSIDVVPLAMVGWLSFGGLASLADPATVAARDRRADDAGPVELRPLPLGAFVAAAAVVAAGTYAAALPFVADLRYREGVETNASGAPRAVAAAPFREAVDTFPAEPGYRARLADQLVAMATQEATVDSQRRSLLEESVIGYEDALERAPGSIEYERALARSHALLDQVDPEGGHLADAAAIYADLTERITFDDGLLNAYGLVLEQDASRFGGEEGRRRRDLAAAQFEKALEIRPTSTTALSALARIAIVEGRLEDARDLLAEGLRLRPDDDGMRALLEQVETELAEG